MGLLVSAASVGKCPPVLVPQLERGFAVTQGRVCVMPPHRETRPRGRDTWWAGAQVSPCGPQQSKPCLDLRPPP